MLTRGRRAKTWPRFTVIDETEDLSFAFFFGLTLGAVFFATRFAAPLEVDAFFRVAAFFVAPFFRAAVFFFGVAFAAAAFFFEPAFFAAVFFFGAAFTVAVFFLPVVFLALFLAAIP